MAPVATKTNGLNGASHLNGTSEDFHTLIRHPLYYIQSADLFFLLRNVQFRVHRYFFERESAYYRSKLSAPTSPGTPKLGSSDNEPIVLSDVSPSDFEKFLWVFYNPRYSLYPAPASTWSSILALAHKWGFAEVKEFCVRELEKKDIDELGDIDRIVVYHANDVDRNLLIPVYAALVAREQSLTLPEGLKLGMETTLLIASAREYVRSHVMEDGSRTPISPTVEGEEMEKIIRDFFGIPTPEGSSASADEVLDAVASTPLARQEQDVTPKLKVKAKKDKDESSAAERTPTVTASATVAAAAKSIANGDAFHGINGSASHEKRQEDSQEAEAAYEGGNATTNGVSADDTTSNVDGASNIDGTSNIDGRAKGEANEGTEIDRPESPVARLKLDTGGGSRPNTPTVGRKAGKKARKG